MVIFRVLDLLRAFSQKEGNQTPAADMRRGIGVGAVKQQQKDQAHFATKRKEVESVKLAVVQTLLSDFRTHLQEFAVKHRGRINSDPEFRRDFHQLCVTTGVDPLASSKGLFADVLGLGQFAVKHRGLDET